MAFARGDGEMARRIRAHDWSATPLGHVETWPLSLRTLVSVVLGGSQPMFVVWGPQRTLLYNDAYAEVLADKHPALGRDFLDVWTEIRDDLAPLVARAYRGEACHEDGIELVMNRRGYPETTYWAYSYTPIHDEADEVAGFFCPCHEITAQIESDRRQRFLRETSDALRRVDDPRDVMTKAVEFLGRYLKANRVGYGQVEPDDVHVVLHSCYADGVEPLLGTFPLDGFGPAHIADQRRGRTRWSDDLARDSDQDPAVWAAIETRAYASVPLLRDGRFVASLYVNFREPHRWTPDEIALVEDVAGRTWSAVERARSQADLRASEARHRFLTELDDALRRTTSASAAMEAATRLLGERLDASRCAYADVDVDEENDRFVIRSDYRAAGVASAAGTYSLDLFGTRAARDMRAGRTLVVHDVAAELPAEDGRGTFRAIGIEAIVCCPLVKDGRLVAMMAVHDDRPRVWTAEEVALVETTVERCWAHVERVAAQARLHEHEERLRLATDHAEVGFWDVDEVEGTLHWPPILKAMFGISPERPVSMQDFYAGLHPSDREAIVAAYAAAADPNRRALYDVEYRTIGREDGVERWIAAKGRGVFDAQGRCLRVVGTAVDITERKRAEEALRDLNETLERRVEEAIAERNLWANLVESSDALIVAIDTRMHIVAMNRAAFDETQRLSGRRPRLGEHLSALFPDSPDLAEASARVWRRALTGETFSITEEFGDATRRRRCYELSFGPLYDRKGRFVGAYQYGTDVTERVAAEARLRETEDALRQAQKMEAVGRLTGGIAHDFNNLLQSVSGSLDLIRRKPHDVERVRRWAQTGLAAAERGARLTGQLLTFSRAQRVEPRPLLLSKLVGGFKELVDRTIGPQIRVTLDLRTDGIAVLGDEVQIEMAVLNLALNARDAMPEGGELTIGTRPITLQGDGELPDGDYVELRVADTGTGMTPEVVSRALDPFFTTKDIGKGTGLGLSQVYGAIRQAGGAVRIESRVGAGTTVRLILRRTRSEDLNVAATPDVAPSHRVSARVLVVDDDADVRRFLMETLEVLGIAATEAPDGATALAIFDEVDPDLVILDFAMPEMNGAEVAHRLRERRPQLPVLMVTGFAQSEALDAIVGDRTEILRKPFHVSELQASLGSLLRS